MHLLGGGSRCWGVTVKRIVDDCIDSVSLLTDSEGGYDG